MKTQFLLDQRDLAELREGRPFQLEVGNGVVIVLQAEHPASARTVAKAKPGAEDGEGNRTRRKSFSKKEQRVILRQALGTGVAEAAEHFNISRNLIYAWRTRKKKGGK